jgi:hypothetical protein
VRGRVGIRRSRNFERREGTRLVAFLVYFLKTWVKVVRP